MFVSHVSTYKFMTGAHVNINDNFISTAQFIEQTKHLYSMIYDARTPQEV